MFSKKTKTSLEVIEEQFYGELSFRLILVDVL